MSLLLAVALFFTPAAPSTPKPAEELLMSVEPTGAAAVCASEGNECLTNGAPHCCKGLRCVGSVCKK